MRALTELELPEQAACVRERDFVHVLRLHAWEAASRQLRMRWIENWILWPACIVLALTAIWEAARW